MSGKNLRKKAFEINQNTDTFIEELQTYENELLMCIKTTIILKKTIELCDMYFRTCEKNTINLENKAF